MYTDFPLTSRALPTACVLAGGFVTMFLVASLPPVTPWWEALALVVTIPVSLYTLSRWPAVFLAPVVFVGNFKSRPATGLELRDPTLWCLILLCTALFVRSLSARVDRPTVAEVLTGIYGRAVLYFILFGVALGISYSYTVAPAYGGQLLLKFVTISGLLFFASLYLLATEEDMKAFCVATVLLSAAVAMKRLHAVLTASTADLDVTSISAGHLIGVAILVVLNYRLVEHPLARLAVLLTLPVLVAGLMASAARGPIVGCLAVAFVSSFSPRSRGLISGLAARGVALLCIFVFAAYALMELHGSSERRRFAEKESELAQLLRGDMPRGSAGARLKAYRITYQGFLEKPLFGWGIGGSSPYLITRGAFSDVRSLEQRVYPHNALLQVAMEQGIVGLILFVAFVGGVWSASRNASTASGGHMGCFVWVFYFNMFVIMVTGDLDNNRAVWLWCAVSIAAARIADTIAKNDAAEIARPPRAFEAVSR